MPSRYDNFVMYIMFKPSSVNSCYVPLIRVNWAWGGSALFKGGFLGLTDPQWQGSGLYPSFEDPKINPGVRVSVNTSDHPEWDANNTIDGKLEPQ